MTALLHFPPEACGFLLPDDGPEKLSIIGEGSLGLPSLPCFFFFLSLLYHFIASFSSPFLIFGSTTRARIMTVAYTSVRRSCFYSLTFVLIIVASSLLHFSSVINIALDNLVITKAQSLVSSGKLPPKIPLILTLHYKTPYDTPLVVHNCIQAKSVGARMIVYTEDMGSKYCSVCTCVLIVPTNCKPPNPRPNAPANSSTWTPTSL